MSQKPEIRFFKAQFRTSVEDGQPTKLEGYAAVFNKPSEDLGGFREVIKPGAFSRTLKEGCDVRALFNHDPNFVLGRSKDGGKTGTLRLKEDETGLHWSCDMPDTQAARDLMTLVERGDIDQCSFGFYVREQNWNRSEDEDGDVEELREIVDVDLFDVSAVTYPAYPQTSVEARALWPQGLPDEVERRIANQTECGTESGEQEMLEGARRKLAQIRTEMIQL